MMPSQRALQLEKGKKQVVKWTAEGAVKCVFAQSILQRDDIRQLSGICTYPEESAVSANQGGTTDKIYSSLTEEYFSVKGFFVLILTLLRRFFI